MTREEAEEIYMAWQLGKNFPKEKLPEAILILTNEETSPANSEGE